MSLNQKGCIRSSRNLECWEPSQHLLQDRGKPRKPVSRWPNEDLLDANWLLASSSANKRWKSPNLLALNSIKLISQIMRFSINQKSKFHGRYFKTLLSPFHRIHALSFTLFLSEGRAGKAWDLLTKRSCFFSKIEVPLTCFSFFSTLLPHITSVCLYHTWNG